MNIRGLGQASITEILVFFSSSQYCLWNDKPINVLPFQKMKTLLPDRVYKYPIKGKDYANCTSVLDLVRSELETNGISNADFVHVDFFMAYIFYEILSKQEESEEEIEEPIKIKSKLDRVSDHSDAEGVLLELGNLFGFDTYVCFRDRTKQFKETPLKEIANLEQIPKFTYQRLLDTIQELT